MPNTLFPVFPENASYINSMIAVKTIGNKVYYFNGEMPFYHHQKNNYQSFRFITSQMIELKNVTQVEITKAFKVSKESVKRWTKTYRTKGESGFFEPRKGKKKGNVLNGEVMSKVQSGLDLGKTPKSIGEELGIKPDTIRKAISYGRLTMPETIEVAEQDQGAKTKSQRNQQDSKAPHGMACTNTIGRIDAVLKKKVATPEFENNRAVENAGVLLALPALLSNGLLSHNDVFDFEEGYYSLPSILLALSFCFMLRVGSIEKISDKPPGELGKLLGLDRIPEVKTLRKKIACLSQGEQSDLWLSRLSKSWMSQHPDLAGVMYLDGHNDVIYSKTSKLPKRYISRFRLAMRGTTDYWVSDKLGQPFFSVSKHVSGSMIETIKQDIVPRLEKDIPYQPTKEMLEKDSLLHKFMIVYDRECYSPDFMIDMWEKRISCCTYNKYVKDQWSEKEFREYEIEDEYGEKKTIKLAERGVLIEGKQTEKLPRPITVYTFENLKTEGVAKTKTTQKRIQKKRKIWVREVRRLSDNGHQTSIITTNYKLSLSLIGMYMFARWCQENFFKYMLENFGLDMLISYFRKTIPDTTQLVNPAWRRLDKLVRSISAKLKRLEAKFGALTYQGTDSMDEKQLRKYNDKKADLQEDISIYRNQLNEHKTERKTINKKINFAELPEDEKFDGVHNERKQLVDTIKMIVFRVEMAMASLFRDHTKKPKEIRSLIVQFFKSDADIIVDKQKRTLYINIHHQPTNRDDVALKALCKVLNETEMEYPGTDMKIIYGILTE